MMRRLPPAVFHPMTRRSLVGWSGDSPSPPLLSIGGVPVSEGGVLLKWEGVLKQWGEWWQAESQWSCPAAPNAQETPGNQTQPSTRTQNHHQSMNCHVNWRPQAETNIRAISLTPMRNSGQHGWPLRVTLINQSDNRGRLF
jgi:hypothetical protein